MLPCWGLERSQTHPPRTVCVIVMVQTIVDVSTQQAWNTWTSLTRPHSEAVCSLSICLTTAQTDLRTGQFRCSPYLPQGSEFDENDFSAVYSFAAIFYFVLLFFCFPFFFTMKHLWSCLLGLSSQFSPNRRAYEWLICMWTGAFTSILIEIVVACCCVAWFPCIRVEELWRMRREDKSVTRM